MQVAAGSWRRAWLRCRSLALSIELRFSMSQRQWLRSATSLVEPRCSPRPRGGYLRSTESIESPTPSRTRSPKCTGEILCAAGYDVTGRPLRVGDARHKGQTACYSAVMHSAFHGSCCVPKPVRRQRGSAGQPGSWQFPDTTICGSNSGVARTR